MWIGVLVFGMARGKNKKEDVCTDCQMLEDCRRLGMLGQMAAVDKGGDVELEARTSRTEVRQVVEAAKAVGCKRVDSLEGMLDSFPDIDVGTSYDFWDGKLD